MRVFVGELGPEQARDIIDGMYPLGAITRPYIRNSIADIRIGLRPAEIRRMHRLEIVPTIESGSAQGVYTRFDGLMQPYDRPRYHVVFPLESLLNMIGYAAFVTRAALGRLSNPASVEKASYSFSQTTSLEALHDKHDQFIENGINSIEELFFFDRRSDIFRQITLIEKFGFGTHTMAERVFAVLFSALVTFVSFHEAAHIVLGHAESQNRLVAIKRTDPEKYQSIRAGMEMDADVYAIVKARAATEFLAYSYFQVLSDDDIKLLTEAGIWDRNCVHPEAIRGLILPLIQTFRSSWFASTTRDKAALYREMLARDWAMSSWIEESREDHAKELAERLYGEKEHPYTSGFKFVADAISLYLYRDLRDEALLASGIPPAFSRYMETFGAFGMPPYDYTHRPIGDARAFLDGTASNAGSKRHRPYRSILERGIFRRPDSSKICS